MLDLLNKNNKNKTTGGFRYLQEVGQCTWVKRGFILTHEFKIWLGLVDKEESQFIWGEIRQAKVRVFTGL